MIWTILAFIGCCVLVFILRGLGELRAKTEKSEKYVTKYPTKWDWKLEELGIKEEWDMEREKFLNIATPEDLNDHRLLEDADFCAFVFFGFPWAGTKKGTTFWAKISDK